MIKNSDSGDIEYPILSNLYPLPKELKDTKSPSDKKDKALIKKYGADNWYDWCVEKWGTKWDVHAQLDMDGEDEATFYFDSAWSPPVEWLHHIAPKFPELSFRLKYDEPGMGFCGVASQQGDACIEY